MVSAITAGQKLNQLQILRCILLILKPVVALFLLVDRPACYTAAVDVHRSVVVLASLLMVMLYKKRR